jgi:hypothetical protein
LAVRLDCRSAVSCVASVSTRETSDRYVWTNTRRDAEPAPDHLCKNTSPNRSTRAAEANAPVAGLLYPAQLACNSSPRCKQQAAPAQTRPRRGVSQRRHPEIYKAEGATHARLSRRPSFLQVWRRCPLFSAAVRSGTVRGKEDARTWKPIHTDLSYGVRRYPASSALDCGQMREHSHAHEHDFAQSERE